MIFFLHEGTYVKCILVYLSRGNRYTFDSMNNDHRDNGSDDADVMIYDDGDYNVDFVICNGY